MFVCLSPGGQSLTVGEAAQDKLLVGTVDGIFAFQKQGGSWLPQGTRIPGKHISSIFFEPASRTTGGREFTRERSRLIFSTAMISARTGRSFPACGRCRGSKSGPFPPRPLRRTAKTIAFTPQD